MSLKDNCLPADRRSVDNKPPWTATAQQELQRYDERTRNCTRWRQIVEQNSTAILPYSSYYGFDTQCLNNYASQLRIAAQRLCLQASGKRQACSLEDHKSTPSHFITSTYTCVLYSPYRRGVMHFLDAFRTPMGARSRAPPLSIFRIVTVAGSA